MNTVDLDHLIRQHEAADMQPDPPMAHPRLMFLLLVATAWFAFIGMVHCIQMAVEAFAG